MSANFRPLSIHYPHFGEVLKHYEKYPIEEMTNVGSGGYAYAKRIVSHDSWTRGLPPLVIKCSKLRFDTRSVLRDATDKESALSKVREQMRTEWSNHCRVGSADGHAPEPYAFGELYESPSHGHEYVRYAILMSWVDGASLDETIARLSTNDECLDAHQTATLGLSIAKAIKKLHEKGVVHRDLSPNNIRVTFADTSTQSTNVTLLDFGISIALKRENTQSTKDLIPTYAYAAPEECRSFTDDPNFARDGFAADSWSLGAILYHMRTNLTPHSKAMSTLQGKSYIDRGIAASEIKNDIALDYPCEDEEDELLLGLIQRLTKFEPISRQTIDAAIGDLSRMLGNYDEPSGATDMPDPAASDGKPHATYAMDADKASLLFDEAMDILSRGPISQELANQAINKLRLSADLDNADACKRLAYIYLHTTLAPRNCAEAARLYRKAAKRHDAEAQYELGLLYLSDEGVPKNTEEANALFVDSAENGNKQAMTRVAMNLMYGDERDYEQAFALLEQAKEDVVEAQYHLGRFYDEGYGSDGVRNYEKAFELYNAASRLGMPGGTIKVAQFYRYGIGPCKKNLPYAAQLLEAVAESGNADAQLQLAQIYDDRSFSGYDPSRAVSLLERSAPHVGKAKYLLATHLLEGTGVPISRERATKLLVSLAESNDSYAAFGREGLSAIHREGIPGGLSGAWRVRIMRLIAGEDEPANTIELAASLTYDGPYTSKRNSEEAYKLLSPLANQGNAEADYQLGMIYYNGLVAVANYRQKAARLLALAAEGKHDGACVALAKCYLAGRGVRKDAKQAATLLQAAANRDDAAAQVYLGRLFEKGNGVEQDPWEALRLYHKAADQDDDEAMYRIGRLYESGALEAEPDPILAQAWYRKAAEHGSERASHALQNLQIDEFE